MKDTPDTTSEPSLYEVRAMKCELCNADPMTANCNGANCS